MKSNEIEQKDQAREKEREHYTKKTHVKMQIDSKMQKSEVPFWIGLWSVSTFRDIESLFTFEFCASTAIDCAFIVYHFFPFHLLSQLFFDASICVCIVVYLFFVLLQCHT